MAVSARGQLKPEGQPVGATVPIRGQCLVMVLRIVYLCDDIITKHYSVQ